jgi:uncharacterized protein YqhQ
MAESQERLRLGGMALKNGLLIHGPTSWAAAARGRDGEIHIASGPKPQLARGVTAKIPGLRGPLRMAEAVAVIPLMRRRLPQARLPFEDWRVLASMGATMAASGLIRRGGRATLARESAVAALGLAPALIALRDRDLVAYHGAEHKAIGGYEQGTDAIDVPKEHERCGSNLIAPLLAFSVAGQVLTERLTDRPGTLARAAAGTGAVSAAVEVFAYAERKPESAIGRAVHAVGHEIQRLLSTREPTPEQLEVGRVALEEILRVEGAAEVKPGA